ncbi:hypothetical protein [Blastopirellula retiformator]|uniref:DUF2383 domain-containing protein n=1 Tax=Blastopirellula retiformator TaxID=2527970 RepID=A0A5C5VA74_9BACT|nr:hypothetical protein [Blastopirellula retiformator]TWT34545.1 hypothetical protein Enr8_19550 [Blastopirellula retiformator]
MSSKPVKEILDQIRSAHRQVMKSCRKLRTAEPDSRMQLLFEFIERHEEEFNIAVRHFEKDAGGNGQLETWLQFTSEEDINENLQQIELTADMSAEEIVGQVLAFADKLIATYRDLAATTSSPQLQELFQDLVQFEEDKQKQYAKMMQDW